MDSFLVFILILLATWYFDKKGKEKKPPRPQRTRPTLPPQPVSWEEAKGGGLPFEIPKIKGAPGSDDLLVVDSKAERAYQDQLVRERQAARRAEPLAEDARQAMPLEAPLSHPPQGEKRGPLTLTPETAREAVVLAEILGKPKALRRVVSST